VSVQLQLISRSKLCNSGNFGLRNFFIHEWHQKCQIWNFKKVMPLLEGHYRERCQWSLSGVRRIQSITSHYIYFINILMLSHIHPIFLFVSFLSFSYPFLVCTTSSHLCYVLYQYHHPLQHFNNILRGGEYKL
jgi:hypothetical protein